MKQYRILIIAAVLSTLVAIFISVRTFSVKKSFDSAVTEALKTSEGYDKKLIEMVNRLEHELATRASFGYKGGKDPMTGKKRNVVIPKVIKPGPSTQVSKPDKEAIDVDPVKLTAIIFDDNARKYTAVVMDGERSLSVEVGDMIRGRHITTINEDGIYMEDETTKYKYDTYGNKATRPK